MAKPKNHNMNPSNKWSAAEWAQKFDALLATSRRTVFEIGEALLLAEQELSKAAFAEAIKKSGIGTKISANNYMRVAQSKVLKLPHIQKCLPTGVGALIDLAAWKQEEIVQAIKDKVLQPHAQRAQLQRWKEKNYYRATGQAEMHEKYFPTIERDGIIVGYIKTNIETWTEEKKKRFVELYKALAEQYDLNDLALDFSEDYIYSISLHQETRLRSRMNVAFDSLPLFKNDPFLKRYWKASGERDWQAIHRDMRSIAQYLSPSDFNEVHEFLKFTRDDWAFLGVNNPGNATITPFLGEGATKVVPKTGKSEKKTRKSNDPLIRKRVR